MYPGVDDHFFLYIFLKVVIMYYGENERFLRIRFPMGWMIFLFLFFIEKVVCIYYGENDFFYFNWIYHSQDDHFYVILLEYGFESKTHIENSFVFVLKINFGVESSKRRSVVIFRKKITVLPENVILCRPPL